MSDQIEEVEIIEPDMPKSSGCGCKNKNKNSKPVDEVVKKNQTLTIILAVIFIGTIIYMVKKKKSVPVPVV